MAQNPKFIDDIASIAYSPVEAIGNAFGRPFDEVVYMLGSTLALLTSIGMQNIKDPSSRTAYSLFFGLLIHIYVFGKTCLVSFFTALGTYLLMSVFRGDK